MNLLRFAGVAAAIFVGACAQEGDEIGPRQVPKLTYEPYLEYGCRELDYELRRVSANLRRLSSVQDTAAWRDDAAAGVGSVLLPLAGHAYLITEESDYGREVARLKGQYEALREAAGRNHCADALMRPQNIAERPGGDVVMGLNLPSGPKPFEGTPVDSFSAQQIEAYCALSWDTEIDPETGRTLYNPCRLRKPFASR